ncbi:MAG: hypothetical protein ACHQ4F_08115 [Candidatus Dormibacteria bacterium]
MPLTPLSEYVSRTGVLPCAWHDGLVAATVLGWRERDRWTAVALAVAVAVAGVAGFLISRPQATPRATPPIGSPALAADTLASTIGYTAAADPGSRHVVVFGGIRPPETFLGDTWGWDGSTWHLLDSGTSGPPPGQASMAWDPALDTMVLMPASSSGADTWTWSGTHWIDHRQPDPYLPTGVLNLSFDPATQVLMGVGFGSIVSGAFGAPTETWTWDGSSWRQLSTRSCLQRMEQPEFPASLCTQAMQS